MIYWRITENIWPPTTAVLSVPDMTVTAMGDSLIVTFQNLPLTGGVIVTEWKTGEELRVSLTCLISI